MRTYQRAIYHLPAVLEDEFAAELFAAGTLGCEARPAGTSLTLAAWFHDQPPAPSPVWIRLGVRLAGVEPVPEQDWLAEYRSGVQPFPLGHHFWIDPGEPDQPAASPPEGRWLLRLPARTAFGVGSHESTRLALELLEETDVAGLSVLDVGTGTGILAFGALLLGAAKTLAFDLDPQALPVARENARLNRDVLAGREPALFAGELSALAEPARFDVLLVNVLPSEVESVLPSLASRLAPGGQWIFSGVLLEQEAELCRKLRAFHLYPNRTLQEGDWVGLRFAQRPGAAT